MHLTVEIEQEDDGRWLAEVPEPPGVLVYGDSRDHAVQLSSALALHTIADQIEAGDITASNFDSISFAA